MLKKGILAFMMISTLALANPVKIVFDVHTGNDAKFQFIMNNLRNLTHNTGNNPKNSRFTLFFTDLA
jgi:hypothetical protein